MRASLLGIAAALAFLAQGPIEAAQVRDAIVRDGAAEAGARQALQTFITEWNTADNVNLRRAMNFPFTTVPGGGVRPAGRGARGCRPDPDEDWS